jgi:LmbE family N-acetylglucosaminyl deacetylase
VDGGVEVTRRVVVLSPHADDAELAMGGYMARLVAEGVPVKHVLLSASSYARANGAQIRGIDREREFRAACVALGVNGEGPLFGSLGVEENEFHLARRGPMVDRIQKAAEGFTELFTCLPWFNQDHTVVWEAVSAATRPAQSGSHVPEVWAYEMPGQHHGPQPQGSWCHVEVSSEHLMQKVRALAHHQTQMDGKQRELIGQAGVQALATLRGLEMGTKYAERFMLVRWHHRLAS